MDSDDVASYGVPRKVGRKPTMFANTSKEKWKTRERERERERETSCFLDHVFQPFQAISKQVQVRITLGLHWLRHRARQGKPTQPHAKAAPSAPSDAAVVDSDDMTSYGVSRKVGRKPTMSASTFKRRVEHVRGERERERERSVLSHGFHF